MRLSLCFQRRLHLSVSAALCGPFHKKFRGHVPHAISTDSSTCVSTYQLPRRSGSRSTGRFTRKCRKRLANCSTGVSQGGYVCFSLSTQISLFFCLSTASHQKTIVKTKKTKKNKKTKILGGDNLIQFLFHLPKYFCFFWFFWFFWFLQLFFDDFDLYVDVCGGT